jgi:predicted kinase
MGTIHLVFGPQGAGKSTYARELAKRVTGIRLSIDDWMNQLYGPDLPKPMNFSWIMERVQRCEMRIWATATDVARTGGTVVLDLGFMKIKSRSAFLSLATKNEHPAQLHFVDAPHDIRRNRVLTRNTEKGETFSFEVTAPMFDFMEREFEPPTAQELASSIVFNSHLKQENEGTC